VAAELAIRVEGVKQTVRVLNRLDPELRKAFKKDAQQIVQPIIDEAKGQYSRLPLSGFGRIWAPRGAKPITPVTPARMRSGVSFSVNTSAKKRSVFKVQQRNRAAAVMDMAGKRTPGNQLDRSLRVAGWGSPSRIMWPAADKHGDQVARELLDLVQEVGDMLAEELEGRAWR